MATGTIPMVPVNVIQETPTSLPLPQGSTGVSTDDVGVFRYGKLVYLKFRLKLSTSKTQYTTLCYFPDGYYPFGGIYGFSMHETNGKCINVYKTGTNGIMNRAPMDAGNWFVFFVYFLE